MYFLYYYSTIFMALKRKICSISAEPCIAKIICLREICRPQNKLTVDFNTFFNTTSTVEQHFNETYELHHLLGQGGFAVVYSGTRVRDNLPVSKSLFFLFFFINPLLISNFMPTPSFIATKVYCWNRKKYLTNIQDSFDKLFWNDSAELFRGNRTIKANVSLIWNLSLDWF